MESLYSLYEDFAFESDEFIGLENDELIAESFDASEIARNSYKFFMESDDVSDDVKKRANSFAKEMKDNGSEISDLLKAANKCISKKKYSEAKKKLTDASKLVKVSEELIKKAQKDKDLGKVAISIVMSYMVTCIKIFTVTISSIVAMGIFPQIAIVVGPLSSLFCIFTGVDNFIDIFGKPFYLFIKGKELNITDFDPYLNKFITQVAIFRECIDKTTKALDNAEVKNANAITEGFEYNIEFDELLAIENYSTDDDIIRDIKSTLVECKAEYSTKMKLVKTYVAEKNYKKAISTINEAIKQIEKMKDTVRLIPATSAGYTICQNVISFIGNSLLFRIAGGLLTDGAISGNAIVITLGALIYGNRFVKYTIPKLKPFVKAAMGDGSIDFSKDFEKNRVTTLEEMDKLIKGLEKMKSQLSSVKTEGTEYDEFGITNDIDSYINESCDSNDFDGDNDDELLLVEASGEDKEIINDIKTAMVDAKDTYKAKMKLAKSYLISHEYDKASEAAKEASSRIKDLKTTVNLLPATSAGHVVLQNILSFTGYSILAMVSLGQLKGAVKAKTTAGTIVNAALGGYFGSKVIANYAIPKLKPLIKAATGDDVSIVKDFEKNRATTLHEMDELIGRLDEFSSKVKGLKNIDVTESVEENYDEFEDIDLPSFE